MAAVTLQTLSPFSGLNRTYAAVSDGDTVVNDGLTLLMFKNGNASSRTLTLTGNAITRSGLGPISSADMTETITIPGSGTNNGECIVGVLPRDRFNTSTGVVTINLDDDTDMTVAAVKVVRVS